MLDIVMERPEIREARPQLSRILLKEFKLSYHDSKTILCGIYPYFGNLT